MNLSIFRLALRLSNFFLLAVVASGVSAQALKLQLLALPAQIKPGEWTKIQVQVSDEAGNLVPNVIVTLEADGGLFADNGKESTGGRTNRLGVFRTEWSCESCLPEHLLEVNARRAGFLGVTERLQIIVEHDRLSGQLALDAWVQPAQVRPGEPARLTIFVRRRTEPAAAALVEVSAGGGAFTGEAVDSVMPTYARGYTDSLGRFQVDWSCTSCARDYVFNVRTTVDGHEPVRARTALDIKQSNKSKTGNIQGAVQGQLVSCSPCGFFQVHAVPLEPEQERRSVSVSSDCRYQISLTPGLYLLEAVQLQGKPEKRPVTVPWRIKVNVSSHMATTVNFQCYQ